ncbi:MAG: hypothetical protein JSV79_09165 [Armatimonadota bacterium]|nr:MAG: hypothetical protein JSV79_09165 [Armatimonadota bacterium]
MRMLRISWIILVAVGVIVSAVPALRQQVRSRFVPPSGAAGSSGTTCAPAQATFYAQRSRDFVEDNFPDDPDMLLAGGLLSKDISLLRRAVEAGGGSAAHAAYVDALLEDAPSYSRVAHFRVDPADPEAVSDARRKVAESGQPQKLSPQQIAPLMEAIRAWEGADPDNALPVALEADYLYGLHTDAEALTRWEDAGRLPTVSLRWEEKSRAVAGLLSEMGMSEADAIEASSAAIPISVALQRLRRCALIALYEGRLALLQGRPNDAMRWCNATVDVGTHMQEGAGTLIVFLPGVAIQYVGASPVWHWLPDHATSTPGGPLQGGRLWYGPQHAHYTGEFGEAAVNGLRDRLVRAKVRSQLTREYVGNIISYHPRYQAYTLLGLAGSFSALLVFGLVLFGVVGTWRCRKADEATGLRLVWQIIIALLILFSAALPHIAVRHIDLSRFGESPALGIAVNLFFILPPALAAVFLPLLAAAFSRSPGARLRAAWRGNLRRVLPLAAALSAVVYLCVSLGAASIQERWVREWSSPETTEMTMVIQALGDAWTDPNIPADAWRAQTPPEQPSA